EEQIENRPARSQCQRVQFVGQGEDDVEVVGVQQIALLRLQPSLASLRLAFWTTAGSAGVIGDGCFVGASFTLILMPAKGSSTAALDGPVCLQLLIVHNSLEALEKLPAPATDDVGHLDGRPRHKRGRWWRRLLWSIFESFSASMGLTTFCRCCADRCRYWAVTSRSSWPSSSWMVRRSVPASSRWVAQLCRTRCGETLLRMPAFFAAWVHARHTILSLMG